MREKKRDKIRDLFLAGGVRYHIYRIGVGLGVAIRDSLPFVGKVFDPAAGSYESIFAVVGQLQGSQLLSLCLPLFFIRYSHLFDIGLQPFINIGLIDVLTEDQGVLILLRIDLCDLVGLDGG